ncbi:hypothetical protein DPV78_001324 [Talaromyces pinophilus]|nr:hypothetical protein DPV78_001324 [Talaromyces pinophilus]
MEYEAREETRADERDADMATEAILPLTEENIAFDQFNCADLDVQVRSTDEVAKRELGGLAKLGAPTTEPISGRVLALLFSPSRIT